MYCTVDDMGAGSPAKRFFSSTEKTEKYPATEDFEASRFRFWIAKRRSTATPILLERQRQRADKEGIGWHDTTAQHADRGS